MVKQCRNCMQFTNGIVLVFPCKDGRMHDWVEVSIEEKPADLAIFLRIIPDTDPPKRAA